jgi:exodeoxyribonuclease V alpha subunit
LASVETGVVLGDIYRAFTNEAALTELRVSRRFKDDSGIGRFAHQVRQAMQGTSAAAEEAWNALHGDDPAVQGVSDMKSLLAPVVQLWKEIANCPDGETARKQFLQAGLLTPLREGSWGVSGLNAAVEHSLGLASGFQRGKPIMITANDPATGLVNGDIGMLWNDDKGSLVACFDRDRRIAAVQLPEHSLCWALTIHKSQGSEWPTVAVALPDKDQPHLLSAELVYTAATRARTQLVIRCNQAVLGAAISRCSVRRSRLAESVQRYLAEAPPVE